MALTTRPTKIVGSLLGQGKQAGLDKPDPGSTGMAAHSMSAGNTIAHQYLQRLPQLTPRVARRGFQILLLMVVGGGNLPLPNRGSRRRRLGGRACGMYINSPCLSPNLAMCTFLLHDTQTSREATPFLIGTCLYTPASTPTVFDMQPEIKETLAVLAATFLVPPVHYAVCRYSGSKPLYCEPSKQRLTTWIFLSICLLATLGSLACIPIYLFFDQWAIASWRAASTLLLNRFIVLLPSTSGLGMALTDGRSMRLSSHTRRRFARRTREIWQPSMALC